MILQELHAWNVDVEPCKNLRGLAAPVLKYCTYFEKPYIEAMVLSLKGHTVGILKQTFLKSVLISI